MLITGLASESASYSPHCCVAKHDSVTTLRGTGGARGRVKCGLVGVDMGRGWVLGVGEGGS